MRASTEFVRTATAALGEINSALDPIRQGDLTKVKFYAQYEPTQGQLDATQTGPDKILLGIYNTQPRPTIVVFESSLRQVPTDLSIITKDVLDHEINQHYFGLNHTVREPTKQSGCSAACHKCAGCPYMYK